MDFFSGIVGQDKVVNLLKSSIAAGNVSHAYLLAGPEGVGKTSIALAFAYTLLAAADPQAGMFIKDNVHPDLMIISKPENKTLIGKEQITREMEPWLALKPFRSDRKVVIIKDSSRMSLEAANAILKTLEEPPAYTVIILVSDELNVLPTILSRCQIVRLFALPDNIVERFLINQGIDPDRAHQAARLAQGSIGRAREFSTNVDFTSVWSTMQNMLQEFSRGHYDYIFTLAEKMQVDPRLYASVMETVLRDVYIYQLTKQQHLLAIPDNIDMIRSIPEIDPNKIETALKRINDLKGYFRTNVNSLLLSTNISYEVFEALN
ncbi:MAG: ATP-binding protein [Syntrophomonadaceae bacterium]